VRLTQEKGGEGSAKKGVPAGAYSLLRIFVGVGVFFGVCLYIVCIFCVLFVGYALLVWFFSGFCLLFVYFVYFLVVGGGFCG
jgi:uncharacterized RDD family membrane protein YckC